MQQGIQITAVIDCDVENSTIQNGKCHNCAYLPKRRSRPNKVQNDGVSVLLDPVGQVSVDHHLLEFVPARADIIHQDLVGGESELDTRTTKVHFLQVHPVT